MRDITEVVAEAICVGRLPRLPARPVRVVVQDPCHLRQVQRIVEAYPRIIDFDSFRRIADLVRSSGVTIVASANAGCEMQLRAHLGRRFRVAHPVELYAERL